MDDNRCFGSHGHKDIVHVTIGNRNTTLRPIAIVFGAIFIAAMNKDFTARVFAHSARQETGETDLAVGGG